MTANMLDRDNFIYKVIIPLLQVLNFMISKTFLTDNEVNCINIFLLMIIVFAFFFNLTWKMCYTRSNQLSP